MLRKFEQLLTFLISVHRNVRLQLPFLYQYGVLLLWWSFFVEFEVQASLWKKRIQICPILITFPFCRRTPSIVFLDRTLYSGAIIVINFEISILALNNVYRQIIQNNDTYLSICHSFCLCGWKCFWIWRIHKFVHCRTGCFLWGLRKFRCWFSLIWFSTLLAPPIYTKSKSHNLHLTFLSSLDRLKKDHALEGGIVTWSHLAVVTSTNYVIIECASPLDRFSIIGLEKVFKLYLSHNKITEIGYVL